MRQIIERNRSLGSFEALCDVLWKEIHFVKKSIEWQTIISGDFINAASLETLPERFRLNSLIF